MKEYLERKRYQVLEVLGQGTFGKVYKVKSHWNNQFYAAKALLGMQSEDEGKMMAKVKEDDFPYLVVLEDRFDADGIQVLIMPLYERKDLFAIC